MTLKEKQVMIQEIEDYHCSIKYHDNKDGFICSCCKQEKEGIHVIHSIYFEKYTDEAPFCIECVNQLLKKHQSYQK